MSLVKDVMGIDLGTTYTCVAVETDAGIIVVKDEHNRISIPSVVCRVKELRQEKVAQAKNKKTIVIGDAVAIENDDGYRIDSLPVGYAWDEGNRLLSDPSGDSIEIPFPAVFYSRILVGYPAKQLMGTDSHPIVFVKRLMGTTVSLDLAGAMFTPEQISAEILNAAAQRVRKQYGKSIQDVVITIPARFKMPGQRATAEAVSIAGLNLIATVPEPVAAAIDFGLGDVQNDALIFCYDFGGGTFDATILHKHETNGMEPVRFGGDDVLGGYNIDIEIARWLLNQLQAEGYSFEEVDPKSDVAQHRIIWQKLLYLAERLKLILSEQDPASLSDMEGLKDLNDDMVAPTVILSRDVFSSLVRPLLLKTIKYSLDVITAANKDTKIDKILCTRLANLDFDHVIMVGGSSRLELAKELLGDYLGQETLELAWEKFNWDSGEQGNEGNGKDFKIGNLQPQLVADPDGAVAKGAAARASSVSGKVVDGIEFEGDIPANWPNDEFDLSGRLHSGESGVEISVRLSDGTSIDDCQSDAEGCFAMSLDLEEGANNFVLEVASGEASSAITVEFAIYHDPVVFKDPSIGKSSFATEDVSIETIGGMKVLFSQAQSIPREKTIKLETNRDDQCRIEIPVFSGNTRIGEAVIDDIPTGTPIGSTIELNAAFTMDFRITGTGLLVRGGKKVDFDFTIPKDSRADDMQLEDLFRSNVAEARSALAGVSNAQKALPYRIKIDSIEKEGNDLIKTKQYDSDLLYRCYTQLSAVIADILSIGHFDPSKETLESLCRGMRLIVSAAKDCGQKKHGQKLTDEELNRLQDLITQMEGQLALALDAYSRDDTVSWGDHFDELQRIMREIDRLLNEAEGGPPPVTVFIAHVAEKISEFDNKYSEVDPANRGAIAKSKAERNKVADHLKETNWHALSEEVARLDLIKLINRIEAAILGLNLSDLTK